MKKLLCISAGLLVLACGTLKKEEKEQVNLKDSSKVSLVKSSEMDSLNIKKHVETSFVQLKENKAFVELDSDIVYVWSEIKIHINQFMKAYKNS